MTIKEYFKDIKTKIIFSIGYLLTIIIIILEFPIFNLYNELPEEEKEKIVFIICSLLLIPVFIYIYFKMSTYQFITPNMEYYLSEINHSLYQSGLLKNMRVWKCRLKSIKMKRKRKKRKKS